MRKWSSHKEKYPTVSRPKALRKLGYSWILALLSLTFLLSSQAVKAQTPEKTSTDFLHQLNSSIESLVEHVSPSVVQIVVTGYRSTEQNSGGQADVVVGRERAIGSGVIVDPDGYIVTNAHVLNGAQQIEVVVPAEAAKAASPGGVARERSYQARIVGTGPEVDLAVLKIEAHGLPALSIRGTSLPKQGEMVFAFGSPE
jgi:serine protease Do